MACSAQVYSVAYTTVAWWRRRRRRRRHRVIHAQTPARAKPPRSFFGASSGEKHTSERAQGAARTGSSARKSQVARRRRRVVRVVRVAWGAPCSRPRRTPRTRTAPRPPRPLLDRRPLRRQTPAHGRRRARAARKYRSEWAGSTCKREYGHARTHARNRLDPGVHSQAPIGLGWPDYGSPQLHGNLETWKPGKSGKLESWKKSKLLLLP